MVLEWAPKTTVMPGMEGIKMLSAMGPRAVTAIRMPSDGRRTSGAVVPPGEESEGFCAGALMGASKMWTAGWRVWAAARNSAAAADGRRGAIQQIGSATICTAVTNAH